MLRLTFSETTTVIVMSTAMICGWFALAVFVWWIHFIQVLFNDADEDIKEIQNIIKPLCHLSAFALMVLILLEPRDTNTIGRLFLQ